MSDFISDSVIRGVVPLVNRFRAQWKRKQLALTMN